MTSDFRPDVEIWLFHACTINICIIALIYGRIVEILAFYIDTDTLFKLMQQTCVNMTLQWQLIQHYNVKRHQLANECLKTLRLHYRKLVSRKLMVTWTIYLKKVIKSVHGYKIVLDSHFWWGYLILLGGRGPLHYICPSSGNKRNLSSVAMGDRCCGDGDVGTAVRVVITNSALPNHLWVVLSAVLNDTVPVSDVSAWLHHRAIHCRLSSVPQGKIVQNRQSSQGRRRYGSLLHLARCYTGNRRLSAYCNVTIGSSVCPSFDLGQKPAKRWKRKRYGGMIQTFVESRSMFVFFLFFW